MTVDAQAARDDCPVCGCPWNEYDGHVCEDRLLARLEAAETLKPWTVYVHSEECAKSSLITTRDCTCGLAAALAAGRGEHAQAEAGRADRDRADRYEFALTTLRPDGEGGFVTALRSEQEVVEDCIRVANERRRAALAAAVPSPADQEEG